ncbi:phage integrase N-terminal SAM-like domain-containing protein [Noviherbaspirillum aerium]|uniref:phage integrase N-terminal SAM-like domain-containing protein n=1 Tax=Noviherbaspirillum aerium TaxID=2588497 RepID=UPI00178C3722
MLDQLRRCLKHRHCSLATVSLCVLTRWYIRFHLLRHPADMGAPEIHAFLSYLSNERGIFLSTHHQALCALLFLYKQGLQMSCPGSTSSVHGSKAGTAADCSIATGD